MFNFGNGYFIIKIGKNKVAFVADNGLSNLADIVSGVDVVLSETILDSGIRSDILFGSTQGEYGLNGLSVKVVSHAGHNLNLLRFSGGLNLSQLSSNLLCLDDYADTVNELTSSNNSSLDDVSLIIIDSLWGLDVDLEHLAIKSSLMIKNNENYKFIVITPSDTANKLHEEFSRIGIEADLTPHDEVKIKKLSDVKSMPDLTITF